MIFSLLLCIYLIVRVELIRNFILYLLTMLWIGVFSAAGVVLYIIGGSLSMMVSGFVFGFKKYWLK